MSNRERLRSDRCDALTEVPASALVDLGICGCGDSCSNVDVTFEIVRDVAGFLSLKDDWNELFDGYACGHQAFQSHNWLAHWCRHYVDGGSRVGRAHSLAVVCVRRQSKLIAVLPFAQYRRLGRNQLRFMGSPVSQYGDVLCAEPENHALIIAAFRFAIVETGADLMELRKVRADSIAGPALQKLGAQVAQTWAAPYIGLSSFANIQDYMKRFSANARKQRRRRRRRLEEEGSLQFRLLGPCKEAEDIAVRGLAFKRDKLKRAGAYSAAFSSARIFEFFRDVAKDKDGPVTVLVSELSSGKHVVSQEIGLVCKGYYIAHIGVFDDAFARFSPGILQIDETIGRCLERGFEVYDLLAPADSYKRALACDETRVSDFVLATNFTGAVYGHVVLLGALPVLRRLKDTVPKAVGRVRGVFGYV